MSDHDKLDEELRRVLEAAGANQSVPVTLQQMTQTQSSVWPWQVPQIPSHMSDHTPQG